MQEAKDLKGYKQEVQDALDNSFLRTAMDNFAVAYRTGRDNAFAGLDVEDLIAQIAASKDSAIGQMDALFDEFKANAEKTGTRVHLARTAQEANEIIAQIAKDNQVNKIVKSKSMTAEETLLNHHLEAQQFEVVETDLGEWIIQLRNEGPSHMVMPAIHLSRYQVADLFSEVTGRKQDSEIERLVKVARRELRRQYLEADMGISGANFAIAATGTIGLTTNEGNARLVTTLPRVHVALVGLEKLMPTLNDALKVNRVLPRNATGQGITSYVTWITGPNACASAPEGQKIFHIVFLDNGRRELARDPVFKEVLRCVRCGACANVCPVYRMVGGHQYGHIYIGAIGLILTYFFHGREKARNLVQNCINCEACKSICAAGIDLPRMIKEVHTRIQDAEGHPVKSVLLSKVMKNRKFFHSLLRSAQKVQKPVTGGTPYLRHLPQIFAKEHNFRALPAIANKAFRDTWDHIKPHVATPRYRIALFAGCALDFVYPEQLEAAVKLLADCDVAVDFPMEQSCCGLPVEMMGEKDAAVAVAYQNLTAIHPEPYDYILTLCASCGSHLKKAYPRLLEDDASVQKELNEFADKIIPFSQFVNDVLKVEASDFMPSKLKATFHAPCHLCRGLGVTEPPHDLIRKAGYEFVPAAEEQTCCGFGGTYSSKFPQISAQILEKKLEDIQKTGAATLITECPGCILQLRGGAVKHGLDIDVKHLSEALADKHKKPSS